MPTLAELVDNVIGVDTHKHTRHRSDHGCSNGGGDRNDCGLQDPAGYTALLAATDRYAGLRAWSIEDANGYGAGVALFLAERGEWVIELDRPSRPTRRHGAKSDPIDAVRAAREALSRDHLAEPRAEGERAAQSCVSQRAGSLSTPAPMRNAKSTGWLSPRPNGSDRSCGTRPRLRCSRSLFGYASILARTSPHAKQRTYCAASPVVQPTWPKNARPRAGHPRDHSLVAA